MNMVNSIEIARIEDGEANGQKFNQNYLMKNDGFGIDEGSNHETNARFGEATGRPEDAY